MDTESPGAGAGRFPDTLWSQVFRAAGKDPGARESWARLYQAYQYPLYAFIRRHGYGPEDAQDLTQGFFEHLLAHQALAAVDRSKGKFRSFLLASLRHYLSNQQERAQARKRGGGCVQISLDATTSETRYCMEITDTSSPDKLFDRNWALALLEEVLATLRMEQQAAGKTAQFEQLQDCLMADPDAPRYAVLAEQLGTSEEAVKMTVSRLRRRYRELLRNCILPLGGSASEVEEEIRYLFSVLGR